MKYYLLALLFVLSDGIYAQFVSINDTYSAQQLVENVLINSPCASVSNISVSGANFGNGRQSYGYFSEPTGNFPFSSGVILSTGKAKSANGPNNSLLDDDANGWGGDMDLEQALNIQNTINATVLEFDFLPQANKINFEYLFASEEYHGTAACQYSDGFAFLLKKAGASEYQNLALIPNTNIPVKVTTVHPEINGGCQAQNEEYFGAYNNSTTSAINFNGQTVVLTAQANVEPGQLYHIKLVIADETNYRYDSAIFLGAGSFKVETDLGQDRLIQTQNPLCPNETLTLDASSSGGIQYQWYKDGDLIPLATQPTYTVNSAGKYSVDIKLSNSCNSSGHINIEYAPQISSQDVITPPSCDYDNDNKAIFNLDNYKNSIISNSENYSFSFYHSLEDAQTGNNPIENTTHYSGFNDENVYVQIKSNFGCVNTSKITLKTQSVSSNYSTSLSNCDNDLDGTTTFNLSEVDIASLTPGFTQVNFYSNLTDLENNTNTLPTNYPSTTKTIYAWVKDGSDCGEIVTITLNSIPGLGDNETKTVYFCPVENPDLPVTLLNPGSYVSYLWNDGSTDNHLEVYSAGTYSVDVKNSAGCSKTITFEVKESPVAFIKEINVTGNSAEIIPGIPGNYLYSLDGINWQNSNTFSPLQSGSYTAYIKNKDSECGASQKDFVIFFIPNVITPNGDGINDSWNVSGFDNYPQAQIQIFDRYGKMLVNQKINDNKFSWNGTYLGRKLASSTYWYIIKLNESTKLSGWIYLRNYKRQEE